jgi:hypothetical protein
MRTRQKQADDGLTVEEESLLRAAEWANHFRAGGEPKPIPSPIRMQEGEQLYLNGPVTLGEHTAQTVTYEQSGFLAIGSVGFVAATAIGSALLNSHRRQQAERQAALQWRMVDTGTFYLTDRRFALQLRQTWTDLWHEPLRASEIDVNGIILWFAGMAPTKLLVLNHIWVYLLFKHIVDREIVWIEIPDSLIEKAQRLGRVVPSLPSSTSAPGSA